MSNQIKGNKVENIELFFKDFFSLSNQKHKKKMTANVLRK